MCGFLKPTRSPIYVQKKSAATKAKVVRSVTTTPIVVQESTTKSTALGPGQYQYVIQKSSIQKQKEKHVTCACACANCKKVAKKPGPNKAHIIVRNDPRKRCNCDGKGNNRWFCDACREAQKKKKGVTKIISCACASGDGSCECHTGSCNNCHTCTCEDAKARYSREVDTWMKESREKMKRARKGQVTCTCNREGCKVCWFIPH